MREFSNEPFFESMHSLPMSLYGELFPVCLSCFLFCLSWNISCLQTFFRALEFTLRTGDKVNLFRLVGYYIERKNPDRLLKPGPRLEAARWLAAGQLHIEAKWGEVIKEDDGGAKKGEWQWQRWTMGVGDDETGTDGRSFYYRSTNSREMAGHWKEAASSDEKVLTHFFFWLKWEKEMWNKIGGACKWLIFVALTLTNRDQMR